VHRVAEISSFDGLRVPAQRLRFIGCSFPQLSCSDVLIPRRTKTQQAQLRHQFDHRRIFLRARLRFITPPSWKTSADKPTLLGNNTPVVVGTLNCGFPHVALHLVWIGLDLAVAGHLWSSRVRILEKDAKLTGDADRASFFFSLSGGIGMLSGLSDGTKIIPPHTRPHRWSFLRLDPVFPRNMFMFVFALSSACAPRHS